MILQLSLQDLDLVLELGVFHSLVQVALIGLAELGVQLVIALKEVIHLLLLVRVLKVRGTRLLDT